MRLPKAYEANHSAYTTALADKANGFIQRDKDAILTAFPYTNFINGGLSTLDVYKVLRLKKKGKRIVGVSTGKTKERRNR